MSSLKHNLFQKDAMQKFGYKHVASDPNSVEKFATNFAQIGVYFQSFNTRFITEEPKYTVTQT